MDVIGPAIVSLCTQISMLGSTYNPSCNSVLQASSRETVATQQINDFATLQQNYYQNKILDMYGYTPFILGGAAYIYKSKRIDISTSLKPIAESCTLGLSPTSQTINLRWSFP